MSQTIEAAKPEAAPQARAKWLESDSWPAYLLRRFGTFVISLWALVTAAFLMLQLIPGDPVRLALGMNAPVELVETTRSQLGYDLPLWQQYFRFVGGLLSGNPGDSITLRTPVFEVIASRLPATLELAVLTVVTVLLVGIPIGLIFAALTRNGRRRGVEIGYTATSGTIAVIPEFMFGTALVYLFAVTFPVLPVAGRGGPESYILRSRPCRSVPSPRCRASSVQRRSACWTWTTSVRRAPSECPWHESTSVMQCPTS